MPFVIYIEYGNIYIKICILILILETAIERRVMSHRHLSLAARFMLLCFICLSRLCGHSAPNTGLRVGRASALVGASHAS